MRLLCLCGNTSIIYQFQAFVLALVFSIMYRWNIYVWKTSTIVITYVNMLIILVIDSSAMLVFITIIFPMLVLIDISTCIRIAFRCNISMNVCLCTSISNRSAVGIF